MKKNYIFLLLSVLTIGLLIIKYNYDYKMIINDPCVTISKLNNLSSEYQKIVYDKNGNLIVGGYDKLNKMFYDEITQKNEYKLYLIWGEERIQITNYTELMNYGFPSGIIDKYSKNEGIGMNDYLIVEDKKKNVIFKLKWYEIYPYKKMVNTMYSGTVSIIVQFKCKLGKN